MMDTLYLFVSICFKKEMAPQPEPRITTVGLSLYSVSMALRVLKDMGPVPDLFTAEVSGLEEDVGDVADVVAVADVEASLIIRAEARTEAEMAGLFLDTRDSIVVGWVVACVRVRCAVASSEIWPVDISRISDVVVRGRELYADWLVCSFLFCHR